MPSTTKTKNARKAPRAASAFVASTEAGDKIVGLQDIRVVLTEKKGYWFAQGVEIDYAAEAATIEEVKKRFENGLRLTIREHLKVFGNIEKVLVVSPPAVLRGFFTDTPMYHSQTSFHGADCLARISGITYLQMAA